MIEKTLYVVSVLTSLALAMSGCCGIEMTPTPTPTSIPTPVPEPVTVDIGLGGGQVKSPDGRVVLIFPPLATDETLSVSLAVREKLPEDGGVLSPIIEITSSPELDQPLNMAAVLTLLEPPQGAAPARYGRLMTLPGQVNVVAGEGSETIAYWLPLEQTRTDDGGHLSLSLAGFSTYAVLPEEDAAVLEQLQAQLDALGGQDDSSVPEGYTHVGRLVTANGVYVDVLSSLPATFIPRPWDLVKAFFSGVGEGEARPPFMIADIYTPDPEPLPQTAVDCTPASEDLEPPPPPVGTIHQGTEVVVNGQRDNDLSTLPFDEDHPAIILWRFKRVLIEEQDQQCEAQIIHGFVLQEQAEIPQNCSGYEKILKQPKDPPDGSDYLGVAVSGEAGYYADLSTIPQGELLPTDVVERVATFKKTANDQVLCELVATHYYVRDAGVDEVDCHFPAGQDPDTALDGYALVAQTVTVDSTVVDESSYLPNGAFTAAGDWNIVDRRTYTFVRDGAEVCTRTEEHTYAPPSLVGIPVYPTWMNPPRGAACNEYKGTDLVVNNQLVESTLPQDYTPQSTDTTVIDPQTDGAYTAHIYRRTSCPCTVRMKVKQAPQVEVGADDFVMFRFLDTALMTEIDWLILGAFSSLSIPTADFGEDGSVGILLAPGTTVETEESNGMFLVTIKFPTDCEEE